MFQLIKNYICSIIIMNEKYKFSVIITASYIKSHPDIRYIKAVIDSLKLCNIDINKVNIILSHDGLINNKSENIAINIQKI